MDRWIFWLVCKLQWVDGTGKEGTDVVLDQPLEAPHGHGGEGPRSVVIQADWRGILRHEDNSGSLEAGRDHGPWPGRGIVVNTRAS